MDIDRARELDDDRLLSGDTPDPEEETTCYICGKQMVYNGDEWVTNAEYDRQMEYWTGDTLRDAVSDKRGTLCSRPCISQAMYNKLDKWDRLKLDMMLDACRTIAELGHLASAIVDSNMGMSYSDCIMDTMVSEASDFIGDVCDGDNAWTERSTLLELSQSAMRDAMWKNKALALRMGIFAAISAEYGKDEAAYLEAATAAKAAHIYLDLKEALGE